MKRSLARVLPFALPLAGLLVLFLVGRANYKTPMELPVVAVSSKNSQIPNSTFVRLRSTSLERLPPVEAEERAEISPDQSLVSDLSDLSKALPTQLSTLLEPNPARQFDDNESLDASAATEKEEPEKEEPEFLASASPLTLPAATPVNTTTVCSNNDIYGDEHSATPSPQADVTQPLLELVSDDSTAQSPDLETEDSTSIQSTPVLPLPEPLVMKLADGKPIESDKQETDLASPAEPTESTKQGSPDSTPSEQILLANALPSATPTQQESWPSIDLRNVELDSSTFASKRPQKLEASHEGRQQGAAAVQLGFELIQRGAPYSARSRFIEALRSLAQSLDDANATNRHTVALRRALAAFHEAADFYPTSSRPDREVNIGFVVGTHSTDLLQDADAQNMTPSQCVREYVAFSEQEFAKALGNEEIGSRALYGLGRLEWATATTTSSSAQVRAYRAMALYQAAIVVHSHNYAAANELGVLLAQHGKTDAAIIALNHSVQNSPQPTALRNLANLYRKVGQTEQAERAEFAAIQAARQPVEMPYAVANPKVEWVEPERFSNVSNRTGGVQVAQRIAEPVAAAPARPTVAPKDNRRSFRGPWPFGRAVSR